MVAGRNSHEETDEKLDTSVDANYNQIQSENQRLVYSLPGELSCMMHKQSKRLPMIYQQTDKLRNKTTKQENKVMENHSTITENLHIEKR
jgi:hypothetical protein